MEVVYGEAASHLFGEDLGGVLRIHLFPQWPCAASSACPEGLILAMSPEYPLLITGLTPGPTLMYRVLLKFTSLLNSAAFLQSSLCLPTCQHLLDH